MGARDLLRRVVARAIGGASEPSPVARSAPASQPVAQVGPTTSTVSGFSLPPLPGDALEEGLEVESPVPGSLLLDVREPGEFAGGVGVGAMLLPMDMVPHHLDRLPKDRPITVYCAAGARSAGVAHWLREQGWGGAVSLAGGIGALRFGGVEVAVPPGLRPGTKVSIRDGLAVDGVPLGPGTHRGEVIEQAGERVRVRVFDAQGFQVEANVRVSDLG